MNSLIQQIRTGPFLMHQLRAGSSLMQQFGAGPPTGGNGSGRGPVRCFAAKAQFPPKTKFRKYQKGRCDGIMGDGSHLAYGKYGLKVLQAGRITHQTLEAARRVLSRKIKGSGQMWIRVFATVPVTSKPLEVRMGKGKGNVSGYIARVKAGQMLYEMDGITQIAAKQAAVQAGHKLGLRTKFVEWS